MILIVFLFLFAFKLASCFKDINADDSKKTVAEYVLSYGYQFEEHKVVTKDGYILTLWRIPRRMNKTTVGAPILLQHGLLDNGFSFLFQDFHKNLPIMLSENNNSDIWICNSRGTIRSLEHINKNDYNWEDSSSKYWDFSWDEMALYDFPAALLYITIVTGYKKIKYICHSQGCSTMLAYATKDIKFVNDHIEKVVMLAPGIYTGGSSSWIVGVLFDFLHILDIAYFVNFKNGMAHPIVMWFSKMSGIYIPSIWLWALNLLCGFTKEEHIDPKRIIVIAANQFGGSSIQNFRHWSQAIKNDTFRMYDFGIKENIIRYGSENPPLYDITKIKQLKFNSLVFSFGRDQLVRPEAVIRLLPLLPSKSYSYEEIPDTNHLSGFWGDFSHKTLYPKIIKFLTN